MLSFWTQLGERPVLAARARVILVLALMGAGLIVARAGVGVPSGAAFAIGAMLGAAGAIAPWRWARGLLAVAVFVGAIGWGQLRWHERAGDDLVRLAAGDERAIVTVEALVTSPPERAVRGGDELARFARREEAWRFTARVDRALWRGSWIGAGGGVWVRVDGTEAPRIAAGARVRLTGVFTPIGPPSNPGEDDARLYGAQEGMSGHLALSGAALVTEAAPADRSVCWSTTCGRLST